MNEEQNEPDDQPTQADTFLLSPRDEVVVATAIQLLQKIINAPFTRRAELVSVAKALQVLAALPAAATFDQPLRVTLSGPDRQFGEHKIRHSWSVEFAEQSVSISAGGHFYRKSTGGDSFTSLQWYAEPGRDPDHSTYLEKLRIVDDAKPFPAEVAALDLTEPGFSLMVEDEGNTPLEQEDEEDDPGEDTTTAGAKLPEQKLTAAEQRLAESADEAEGRRQGQTYVNPSENCDLCDCSFAERTFFVDARLRGQIAFGCLCAECFFQEAEGIGWGMGQLYKRQPNGAWLMVAGFRPEEES
jgi:hypothetical protein